MPARRQRKILNRFGREFYGSLKSDNSTPKNPMVLEMIVMALCLRIGKTRPREMKFVGSLVGILANLEKNRTTDIKSAVGHTWDTIDLLASGYVPRGKHWKLMPRFQRDLLKDYVTTNKYPVKANNRTHRKQWVKDHEAKILKLIGEIPCLCQYQLGLAAVADKAQYITQREKLISEILAHLHGTTLEYIRNLLKPQTK